ncbi:hypothetical protein B0T17DRAFT_620511 [Bombardia bombarda]|uniref:Uncharacterized protein n=1 Tax=Bombardia bombarda TaxID=252184 RepID=A0AA39TI62_9PEZI|nr:hypothetical protein B0T17DRAFT_620511 [Bombardia bombarda]
MTATNWTPSACLPQRWKTDAAILIYLREKTSIPLLRLQHTFEDDGAFYFKSIAGFGSITLVGSRRPKPDIKKGNYVFCHNDLGQHNVIVDPETLKINACSR